MRIQIKLILSILVTIVLTLTVLHWLFYDSDFIYRDRFDLNREANLPTWFSSMLLFSVSVCAILIYLLRKNSDHDHGRRELFWILFAMAFCLFSMDETARFHETIGTNEKYKWLGYYTPFAILFLIANIIYFRTSKYVDNATKYCIIGGLCIFMLGGMGVEFIFHHYRPMPLLLENIEYTFEEGLELLGVIWALGGCFYEINFLIKPAFPRATKT